MVENEHFREQGPAREILLSCVSGFNTRQEPWQLLCGNPVGLNAEPALESLNAHLPQGPQVVLRERPRRRPRGERAVRGSGARARLQSPACCLGEAPVGCLRGERSNQGRQRGRLRLRDAEKI